MNVNREAIEKLETLAALPLSIETAQLEGEQRRIKGYANTFGVMRSQRIIHPQGVEDWLAANPGIKLPLLAQHGYVPGFATIGVIDVLKVQRSKGLYFEATIAEGIDLADQAWHLISQGMLGCLSVGWASKQRRWVRADDKDIDPWFAKKMKEAGVTEALAFLDFELTEISLVDVPDDRGAKLAASGLKEFAAQVTALGEQLSAFSRQLSAGTTPTTTDAGDVEQRLADQFHKMLKEALGQAQAAAGDETAVIQKAAEAASKAAEKLFEDFAHGLENRLCEVVEANLANLQAAYCDDDYDARADGDGIDDATDGEAAAPEGADVSALLERVRKVPV